MKSILIRSFVVLVALSGFGASTFSANASMFSISSASRSVVPMPTCAPSDPSFCGLQ